MGAVVRFGLALVLASPDEPGPGRDDGPAAVAVPERSPEARAEYAARKARASRTAASQVALAVWCRDNGLPAEAQAHAVAAIQLGSRSEAPWKILGFRKVGGRWLTEGQVRDEEEQREANREWAARISAWHRALHGSRKKGKTGEAPEQEARRAEDELARIDDPRAVPTIYREFAQGTPADQELAVQLFGQNQAPRASQALAALAIYGATPDVRRRAVETLRTLDVGDYADALLGLLTTPLRYRIDPPSAAGRQMGELGALMIEGEDRLLRRSYTGIDPTNPAQAVDWRLRPGDIISYDAEGAPAIYRKDGAVISGSAVARQYQNAAMAAQARLERDIAAIEAENAARRTFNAIVFDALKDATGQRLPDDGEEWKDWLAETLKRPREEKVAPRSKPTWHQIVKPYAGVMPGNEGLAALARPYESLPFT